MSDTLTDRETSSLPGRSLLAAAVVASLGGLLFGFDTIVISGCQTQLEEQFSLSGFMQGFMTASALIGTAIGALVAGYPGDRFGRRDCLKVCGGLYLVSALGSALAWDLNSLVLFRLVGGLGVGGSTVLGPLYLAEVSPAEWRGRLVSFFQFNIVFGVLVAFFSNLLVDRYSVSLDEATLQTLWRWKLGIEAFPAMLFLISLFFIPRSPRWLVLQGDEQEAVAVLKKFGEPDPIMQTQRIRQTLAAESDSSQQPLWSGEHAKPIFLAITIASFNQFGGINALWYYLNPILESGGYSREDAGLATILLGVANLFATMLGMVLIDRLGRKPLLLASAFGTLIAMGAVALIFSSGEGASLLVWLLTGVVVCHTFGQGAVIWVYISEVFPGAVRAKGQTLGSFTHWFWAMIVSWTFPMVAGDVGEPSAGLPFAFFAGMMIVQLAVVWFAFPETKQVPLESMHSLVEENRTELS
ncbi:sugar porter family MFS transporter [Rhodopirellula sp. MGV]|uniref:sugar porter family MFS transporter n=1 Tax=Rhodopirellula sp. MGV TaxID=2023130 RepID=UPI000B965145|nr:sugar porter family MFS transporter [Rhodopirellula sp. MGV]OYP37538.1 MFS transporter [Rhodopirellula sp. MGV]PNY37943.1 MFS transporter [Rhodopirellula baltica]